MLDGARVCMMKEVILLSIRRGLEVLTYLLGLSDWTILEEIR